MVKMSRPQVRSEERERFAAHFKCIAQTKAPPTLALIRERARQFADCGVAVDQGRLFCMACKKDITNSAHKKSHVSQHCESDSHKRAREARETEKLRQETLAQSFKRFHEEQGRPDAEYLHRITTLRLLLANAIPLNKLEKVFPHAPDLNLREALDRGKFDCGGRGVLAKLIPNVLKVEMETVQKELGGLQGFPTYTTIPIGIVFDGTTKVAETYALLGRFMTEDGYIQQRLLSLPLLKASLIHEEVAGLIMREICDVYAIKSYCVLSFMHDRASVNIASVEILAPLFNRSCFIGCFSHTINNAGRHFFSNPECEFASDFRKKWSNLIAHSSKVRSFFFEHMGEQPLRLSPIRWYSEWEVVNQLWKLFSRLSRFLEECLVKEYSVPSVKAALELLIAHGADIAIHLCAISEAGDNLVRACYYLEGDGLLCVEAFDKCQEVRRFMDAYLGGLHPQLSSVAQKLESIAGLQTKSSWAHL
jgi:hypothetical protein